MDNVIEFWLLAFGVGVFQGGIQSLSRSYFTNLIPKEKSSEYFGIYDIFGKGAAFWGTMIMGVSTQIFQTSKAGIVVLALMFIIGFMLINKKIKSI